MSAELSRPDLPLTEFHGMVTTSHTMRKLFALLERVAGTDTSIVLRGETGTGKELAARAIHELSPRRGRPFRAINCATLTPDLAASELFGHVRGAFTGAVTHRPGLFSLADTGTVFLDEVAELPLDVQSRLLRVLQERVLVPVGGSQPKEVDIRLVTATHKSLREEVEARRFREDLMYRLRVVPIFIPPLVEREGDVEALLWHFIAEFNRRGGRQVESLSPQARSLLLEYHWPGNVRELRNAVEYAFTVGEGPVFDEQALPPELRGELPPHREGQPSEEAERSRIEEALRMSGGQKSQAADLLGISRTTLWRRMRELKVAR